MRRDIASRGIRGCGESASEKLQKAHRDEVQNADGARGRHYFYCSRATKNLNRSLPALFAIFKSASRCVFPSSLFSVLHFPGGPAHRTRLRPQTLILSPFALSFLARSPLLPSLFLSLSRSLSLLDLFVRVKFTLRRPCKSRCAHKFLKRKQRCCVANNTRLRNYCSARNVLLIFYSLLPAAPLVILPPPPVSPCHPPLASGSLLFFRRRVECTLRTSSARRGNLH